jgi:single-strand DNA-binding protein
MKNITLIGNITRDAEIRDFSNRKAINFSVAVNESYTSNGVKIEKSSFFNCTLWRENTNIANYLKKGIKVYIQSDNFDSEYYQNKEGEIKTSIKITVNKLELISSQNQTQPAQQNQNESTISSSTLSNDSNDDLPF